MPGVPSALIIGGSIAGLFAAHALARRGWDVTVCERNATELSGRGAGIVTHPELLAALGALGLPADERLGVPVGERRVYGRDGATLARLPFPQTNTSWERVFRLLRDSLPAERYRLGARLEAVEPGGPRPVAVFADGTRHAADLLVAADGIRSTLRGRLLPEVAPRYAGYVAWRGLVAEAELSPPAREALFAGFTFCLPPGEQMLGYPVAGPGDDLRPGFRRFNFVWYRPADAEAPEGLRRLLTDAGGQHHPDGIPPPRIAPAVIAEMRRAAAASLAPGFAEAVERTAQPFFQPIADLLVPRLVVGRVALIGDAAAVARPHVGAGVTKAAEDALALARALAEAPDIEAGLARFEAERLPVARRIVERGRELGAYMQAQRRSAAERAAAERHRSPEAVLRETASLAFLRPAGAAA